MNIIMLGAQGTGKGTVAGLISEQTGLPQISTGDIFRKNISEKTPLGVEADKYISKGNLVPDEITVPMVEDRLTWDDAKNGVILDGFPRTIEQAEKLDKMLEAKEAIYDDSIIVRLDGIKENGLNLLICSYTDSVDYTSYLKEVENINYKIMKMLKEEGIELAYDTKTVLMKK